MLRWQTTNYPQGIALAGQSVMPSNLGRPFADAEETSKAHRDRWRT